MCNKNQNNNIVAAARYRSHVTIENIRFRWEYQLLKTIGRNAYYTSYITGVCYLFYDTV